MEINKLIKLEKKCEENEKCPYCKEYSLTGTSPFDIILICTKCGSYFSYDERNKKIYEIGKEEKK